MSNFEVELTELRNENKLLKELLVSHGISLPVSTDKKITVKSNHPSDSSQLNPTEKIKLFRSLFRGRDDVYPIRWESSQSGKTGYSPVCANEWRKGVCEKPRIKCGDCNHGLTLSTQVRTAAILKSNLNRTCAQSVLWLSPTK